MPYICEDLLIDEDKLKLTYGSSDPKELSYFLAEAKAKSLSTKFRDHIILGCDQICFFDGKIFEKPLTISNANKNLKELSGNQHQLIGSYVFIKNDELITTHETTCTLTMKKLTDNEISNYIELDSPLNSCASYMFEANGYKLFNEVIGSLEEINGLPFKQLRNIVNEHL